MSGHSHWSKIKRAKGATDAKRGKTWSKLARRIIVAAKSGGNLDDNLQLRYAIDEARAENMPRDTIQNAIKKGTGELGAANYETVMYEGYGPGGVAVIIDVLTDNRQRTAPELRKIFERAGSALGANNCVAWMFNLKGIFGIPAAGVIEDALMELALDAGADDVRREGDEFIVTSEPAKFQSVKEALARQNITVASAQLAMVPTTTVKVEGEKVQKLMNFLEVLDEHEDVQNVYANYELSDEDAARLAGGK